MWDDGSPRGADPEAPGRKTEPGERVSHMPGPLSRARSERPIEYRDRQGRVWYATQVAQLKIVTPSIDGPNLFLVIRFEHEGEKRFVRWLGGDEWRGKQLLHRLFAEAEV